MSVLLEWGQPCPAKAFHPSVFPVNFLQVNKAVWAWKASVGEGLGKQVEVSEWGGGEFCPGFPPTQFVACGSICMPSSRQRVSFTLIMGRAGWKPVRALRKHLAGGGGFPSSSPLLLGTRECRWLALTVRRGQRIMSRGYMCHFWPELCDCSCQLSPCWDWQGCQGAWLIMCNTVMLSEVHLG